MNKEQIKETGACVKLKEIIKTKAISSENLSDVVVNRFYQLHVGPCACVSMKDGNPPYRALHIPTGRYLGIEAPSPYLSWINASLRINESGGSERVSEIMQKLPVIVGDDMYVMKVYYHYLRELETHLANTK